MCACGHASPHFRPSWLEESHTCVRPPDQHSFHRLLFLALVATSLKDVHNFCIIKHMTTKTLVYTILAIAVIFTGAYYVISPIALSRTIGEPDLQQNTGYTEYDDGDEVLLETASIPADTKNIPASNQTDTPAPATYTSAQVALHASRTSCWTIVNGSVYDITSYIPKHPGGSEKVLRICGTDGTALFTGQHGGQPEPEKTLAGFKIGSLK